MTSQTWRQSIDISRLLALAVFLTATGCTPPAPPPERDLAKPAVILREAGTASQPSEKAEEELLAALVARLQVMHDVAKYKWNEKLPIDDPQREERLLSALQRRGEQRGLSPAETRRLMRAQIEAGKLVQRADWDAWQRNKQRPFAEAPDLQKGLRPQIDRLSEQLLAAYGKLHDRLGDRAYNERFRGRAESALTKAGFDETVRAAALREWLAPPQVTPPVDANR